MESPIPFVNFPRAAITPMALRGAIRKETDYETL